VSRQNSAGPPPVDRVPNGQQGGQRMTAQQERALVAQNKLGEVVQMMNRADRYQTFVDLLGSPAAVDRWKAIALHTMSTNSDLLLQVTPESLVVACREAAAMNLDVTGLNGDGWLIAYGTEAKFQAGWRGYLKLIRRSRQVRVVDVQLVYTMDPVFELRLGTSPSIEHVPATEWAKQEVLTGRDNHKAEQALIDRGDVLGGYAYAKLATGELLIEWMTWAEIEQARKASPSVRANRASPWDNWWGEMARKTLIRRLSKRLPFESLAEKAMEIDNELDDAAAKEMEAATAPSARNRAREAAQRRNQGTPDSTPPGDEPAKDPPADGEQAKDDGKADEQAKGAEPEQPAADTTTKADIVCGNANPWNTPASCIKPAGHDGLHRNADKESWGEQ
jgi:recombination protein RecT